MTTTETASAETTDTQSERLLVERDGAVLRVTFNNPSRLNAISGDMMVRFSEELAKLHTPEYAHIKVVVITGNGRAFSTGADLNNGAMHPEPDVTMGSANRIVKAMNACPVPIVARVNGPAAGIGVSLALGADITIAAEEAYFLLAFINIGLVPDGGTSELVKASIGRAKATAMALLGERLPAREAAESGLIYKVTTAQELDAAVDKVVTKLANGPRRAQQLTAFAMREATLTGLSAALTREADAQVELLLSDDFKEGATAMITKRAPKFA